MKLVDISKGDDVQTNYRSRLVVCGIGKMGEDSIFAFTPPLESLRVILGLTPPQEFWPEGIWNAEAQCHKRFQISLIDISRVYFNARTKDQDPMYVEVPKEDVENGKGFCEKLFVHMYGARRAADGWHSECSETLEDMDFIKGRS